MISVVGTLDVGLLLVRCWSVVGLLLASTQFPLTSSSIFFKSKFLSFGSPTVKHDQNISFFVYRKIENFFFLIKKKFSL